MRREAALAITSFVLFVLVSSGANSYIKVKVPISVVLNVNCHTMRILIYRVSHYAVDKTRLLTNPHCHRIRLEDLTVNYFIGYPDLRIPYEQSR